MQFLSIFNWIDKIEVCLEDWVVNDFQQVVISPHIMMLQLTTVKYQNGVHHCYFLAIVDHFFYGQPRNFKASPIRFVNIPVRVATVRPKVH